MATSNVGKLAVIAVLGMVVLIFTNGMTFTGLQFFDEKLLEAFSWDRSTLKFRDFINLVCAAMIVPFVGAFIDRFGVKTSLIIGLVLLSICYYLYGFIQNEYHMYGIHIILAFAVASAGTLTVIIMVSQRINKHRGTAMGIALAGTSLGGYIIPLVSTQLMKNDVSWRQAFQYEAILPIALILIILIVLRSEKSGISKVEEDPDLQEIDFSSALRSKTFWMITAAGFLCFYSIMGIIMNMFLYIRELGFSAEKAVTAFAVFSFVVLGAKFLSGFLTDYFNKYLMFRVQLIIMTIGAALLAMHSSSLLWVAVAVFAAGWGGLYTLFQYVIITTFGVKSAGKIGGVISAFESIGGGLGIWLTGALSDEKMFGSYAPAFWLVVGFLSLAFIISFQIKPVHAAVDPKS